MKSIELIEKNKSRFLDELLELLRIPSVSADPQHKDDMINAAYWLENHLKGIGLDNVTIHSTPGHP
ncbi:MAG: peptidase dimerization domain protein, partial [Saprospiraceae bacterium]